MTLPGGDVVVDPRMSSGAMEGCLPILGLATSLIYVPPVGFPITHERVRGGMGAIY